ncbi:stonustoxin subunit alpha-like, partial [Megalobrama amblycephala]|uniref:stonustoxin subunit alpha-like n=1 Tax=Megalobrama amblycephala TaxID=75352 RepID=UPI0020142EE4
LSPPDSHRITLDLNTVNKYLCLSERNRVITDTVPKSQQYRDPDHPDRFDYWHQVLCGESVSDRRCYWEIEWSGYAYISVSYKSISRKGAGEECEFGANDQSWSLRCSPDSYSFWHNKIVTDLPVKPIISRTEVYDDDDDDDDVNHNRTGVCYECLFRSNDQSWSLICSPIRYLFRHNKIDTDLPVKPIISRTVNEEYHYRVGVYVDHSAGTLSFYSVSGDTMILIHTVQTTFTQPLYPGFRVYHTGSSVKLC